MVGLLAIVVGLVLVALVVIAVGLGRTGAAAKAREEEMHDSSHSLSYTVPAGHDPAVVLAALHRAGFRAAQDSQAQGLTGGTTVLIDAERGSPDREAVRDVIAHVDAMNLEGDRAPDLGRPRFADE